MRSPITNAAVILAAVSSAAAQAVKGTAYGFATGVTGGGSAAAAAPSSADELATWLSDDTERVILVDQEYDFTGTSATDAGCDRKSCSYDNGGQLYIGDLSCGASDNVAVSSITYDAAGPDPLKVGSNKSLISSNGKGVLKGKVRRFIISQHEQPADLQQLGIVPPKRREQCNHPRDRIRQSQPGLRLGW